MLWQRTDPQANAAQALEVTHQLPARNADESGCEAALRHERLLGAGRDGGRVIVLRLPAPLAARNEDRMKE